MHTRSTLSSRFGRTLLAVLAVALLALSPAQADPSRVTTPGADSGGFSPAPGGGSIFDDILNPGGMTPINYCPAPSGDPCDPSGPASIGTGSGANLGAGNPIHLASGNKYRRETDLPALPGPMGLEIVRHYNSTLAAPELPLGILGRGWRLSYETELAVFDRAIHILQADGSRVFFARTGADTLVAHDPAFGRLVITGSPSRPEGFRWHWPDGRTLDFDARGRLLQILAADGHFVTLTRGPRGELLRVTDPQGRSLVFEYAPRDANGFRGVVAIGSPVGRFVLEHQNTRTAPGFANLVAVNDPEGAVRRYHYGADEAEFAPHLPHHLTGISVESDQGAVRVATYDYDARGRATLSVRGVPLRTDETGQPVPGTGIEQVTVDYPERGGTVVTNSLGERTTYRHTVIHSGFRLLEAIGPGCASCGPTNRRYAYDALGRMVEETVLDARGTPISSTLTRYDALGRVSARGVRHYTDGTASEAQALARYEYAGDTPRPTLIARPSVVPGAEHQSRITYNAHGQPIEVVETGFSPLDAAGEVAATADAATRIERTTTYAYTTINGRSLLAEIDGPLANGPANDPSDSDITRFSWDAGGNHVVRVIQPGHRVTDIAYEATTGMVARVENRQGTYSEFSYNARLQTVRVRSHGPGWAQPHTIEHRFDAFGRLAETTALADAARNTRVHFDAHGRLEWVANALGVLETLEHDRESRLVSHRRLSASFEQSRFWQYDEAGRLETTGDNRGSYVQAQYDDQGYLAALHDTSGRTRLAASTSSGAAVGDETALGVVRLFDDFGQLVWRASPDAGVQQRQFDAAGRLVAMRDAVGHRARYEYDVRGRIERQTVTDAQQGLETITTWRYDGDRLVELAHPTQHERYTYDARGLRTARIVTIPTEAGGLTTITRYQHDSVGRLVATTLPDGSTLHYRRNGQAQVVSVARSTIQTSWLRRFAREQTIGSDFERDLVGLRRFTTGNGIETRFERSREGALARTVHRRLPAHPHRIVAKAYPSIVLGQQVFGVLERVLGIRTVHASPVQTGSNGSLVGASPASTALPGALGLPVEAGALLDRRYLWDRRGNLLHTRQSSKAPTSGESTDSHAYDAHGQLVASVRSTQQGEDDAHEHAVWRYAYGPSQRRVLAQQGAMTQSELVADTTRTRFEPGTHRRIGANDTPTRYNANGQPLELDGRTYEWDALGRLVAVHEAARILARYGYDHRGLRNRKTIDGDARHTLHDDTRQPLAELDANGRILRQYVWVADLPLAVIDTPEGVAPAAADPSAFGRIAGDLRRIVQSWSGSGDTLVWLHTNHLNAPELATAVNGDIVWRAHYSPFGAATVQNQGFTLDLRLPGQRFDAETGLHYNRQRYYDPEHGQYLTPDPLGTPDGPNPYAYVAFSPLSYIDPDGLILFAFDGTGNTRASQTNVFWLDRHYEDNDPAIERAEEPFYIEGPGTGAFLDGAFAYTLPDRVNAQLQHLDNYIRSKLEHETTSLGNRFTVDAPLRITLDIIGFSRGAAAARHFANQVIQRNLADYYNKSLWGYAVEGDQQNCIAVDIRFMGVFDTVLSTAPAGIDLSISTHIGRVAHAIAVNEHRALFPLESVESSYADRGFGSNTIEMGFIGAHSDIGGGYTVSDGGDLSNVALNWMWNQMVAAGVPMKPLEAHLTQVTNPILHDESGVGLWSVPGFGGWSSDRDVRYPDGALPQREAEPAEGMTWDQSQSFITYHPPMVVEDPYLGIPIETPCCGNNVGTVDMVKYREWLTMHGIIINE